MNWRNSGSFTDITKARTVTVERSRFVSVKELERMGEPLPVIRSGRSLSRERLKNSVILRARLAVLIAEDSALNKFFHEIGQ